MKKSTNSKKKSSSSTVVNDGNKSYFVFKHGIKIYPISVGSKFKIEADNNGELKTFDKLISQKEINDSLAKTVNWYYEKLNEKK